MYRLNQQRLNLYRMAVPKVMVVVLKVMVVAVLMGAVQVAVLLRGALILAVLRLAVFAYSFHKLLAVEKSAAFASNRYVRVYTDQDRVFWNNDFCGGNCFREAIDVGLRQTKFND